MEPYLVENLILGIEKAERMLNRCEELNAKMEDMYENCSKEIRNGTYHFSFRYKWIERLLLKHKRCS